MSHYEPRERGLLSPIFRVKRGFGAVKRGVGTVCCTLFHQGHHWHPPSGHCWCERCLREWKEPSETDVLRMRDRDA